MIETLTTTHVQTLDMAAGRLQMLNGSYGMSWRKIAEMDDFRGIPPGTLCAISKGRDIKKPNYRAILHMPTLIPTAACSVCGEVHVKPSCPKSRKKSDRPRISWKRKYLALLEKYAALQYDILPY